MFFCCCFSMIWKEFTGLSRHIVPILIRDPLSQALLFEAMDFPVRSVFVLIVFSVLSAIFDTLAIVDCWLTTPLCGHPAVTQPEPKPERSSGLTWFNKIIGLSEFCHRRVNTNVSSPRVSSSYSCETKTYFHWNITWIWVINVVSHLFFLQFHQLDWIKCHNVFKTIWY